MASQPYGWGLIGASTIAAEHMIGAIRSQPGHDVVCVASRSPARARDYAAAHGIARACDSVAGLLADPAVQAVYVSTTNERHRDDVLAAAAAGKHVLCEKPLALTLADAREMAAACEAAGVVMATNHHLRNAATHRRIRQALREGAIGRPLFARVFHAVHLPAALRGWRIDNPAAGGGVTLDIAVHDTDTLRFILDAEPLEAVAMAQAPVMARQGLADGVMAVLRFDNGVLAQLHDAYTTPHAETGIEIHGERGSLIGRNVMTQQPAGEVILRDGAGERRLDVAHEDLYARGVARFCAALRGAGPAAATAADGIRSLAAALAIAEACRSGQRVRIAQAQAGEAP